MNEDELWSAYQRVVFKLIDTLPQTTAFTIITADYPQGRTLDETQLKQRRLQLYEDLKYYGQPYRLYGCSRDLRHCELSYATVDITLADTLKIARDYRQNAIYEVQNDRLYLHACLLTHRPKVALGSFTERIVDV